MATRRSGLNLTQRNGITFGGTGPEQDQDDNKKLYIKSGQTTVTQTVNGSGKSILSIKGIGDENKTLELDLDDITATLTELKQNHARFLKALDVNVKSKFDSIVGIISILYDTAAYEYIHERIARVFSDVKSATPGTVGAYFTGCMLSNNFNGNPGCTATCASGVPPPKSSATWPHCENLTILYDNDRVFNTLNMVNDPSKAIIFLPSTLNFNGFTATELRQLEASGVKQAKLTRYSADGTQYQDIFQDFIDLSRLALREKTEEAPDPKTANSSNNSASNAAVIILVILLIILILAIFWQVYQRR